MSDQQPRQVGGGRKAIGDVAPKLAALTDDVLFDDVWNRPGLAARDRPHPHGRHAASPRAGTGGRGPSLVTVAALVAGGDLEQLRFHLGRAKENGVTEEELIEAITHLAFYVGWPKAMGAVGVAKQVFAG